MLKKIRIQNFKCYLGKSDFELSRVNFIYGNNSVGKSTFLQAVEKTCKAFEGNRPGVLLEPDLTFRRRGFDANDTWMVRVCLPDGSEERDWVLVRRPNSQTWDWMNVGGERQRIEGSEALKFLPQIVHEEAQIGGEHTTFDKLAEDPLTQDQIGWINEQFAYMKLGYRCVDARSLDDTEINIGSVALPDVGAGIRDLFRHLKALARWESGILLLEEPESHVNEDQLAAWTRVIVRRAMQLKRDGRDAQLCVECHSEHMLLMLLTGMVRRLDGLANEDVSIHYVKKQADGSHVTKCNVDAGGEFDQWPSDTGFFKARNRILFGELE